MTRKIQQKTYLKSQQGPLRHIWSLGALGKGSGWDLRIRQAPAAATGIWKSKLVWNGSIWLDMAWYSYQNDRTDVAHLFRFQEIIKNWHRGPKKRPMTHFFQKSEISKNSRSVHSGWAHIKLNGLESCRVERCDTPNDFFMGWMARSGQNWHFFGPPQPVHGGHQRQTLQNYKEANPQGVWYDYSRSNKKV